MHPFHFGTSSEPLFGSYHPATARVRRSAGVVLCYPTGQEYMRGHRAFRQLAMLLTKSGFDVLRFDYFGSGDSAGAGEEWSLERSVDDAIAALDELRDTAEVELVSIVGLRLGAAIAALATTRADKVDTAVLWDPVVRGSDYVQEMSGEAGLEAQARVLGINGFPLTDRMISELSELDLTRSAVVRARRVLLATDGERKEYGALRRHLVDGGLTVQWRTISSGAGSNWAEVDNFGSALIPQELIREIVNFFNIES